VARFEHRFDVEFLPMRHALNERHWAWQNILADDGQLAFSNSCPSLCIFSEEL